MPDELDRVRANYDEAPEREWDRLTLGAHGRLEYLVTMHALAQHLPAPAPDCRLLDAGGGPGRYSLALARQGYRVTLLDLSPALLTLARERIAAADPAISQRIDAAIEGSITDLTMFADAQFDATLCLGGVLSHLPDATDRQRALRELRRVLRLNGRLFVSAFNRLAGMRSAVQWPQSWPQFFPRLLDSGHIPMGPNCVPTYAFYPEEFVAELAQAGLAVHALYGCQGLGAHLPEERLLAVLDDPERWPLWQQALLATCDHPNIVGLSSHLLAVARAKNEGRSGADSERGVPMG